MVDSIASFFVKGTVGKVVGWGRDKAAERLARGNAIYQKFGRLIERDENVVKRELFATKEKDLKESIILFEEGTCILEGRSIQSQVGKSEVDGPHDESDSPLRKKKKIDNDAIDEAKERFREARQKATSALANSALTTKDKISATRYKIKAQLEESKYSSDAFTLCVQALKKLHSSEDIAANFKTEIKYKGIPSPKKSVEGRAILWDVCHLNRQLFDLAQEVEEGTVFCNPFIWPCIEIKINKERMEIDPLRDPRLDNIFRLEEKECCSVIFSFGQEGDEEQHKIKLPRRVVTNAQGHFIVLDGMTEIKAFDNSGKYLNSLSLSTVINTQYHAVDLDTDQSGNVYVLVSTTDEQNADEVYVFDKDGEANPCYKFQLDGPKKYKECKLAAVNLTEVLVLKRQSDSHLNAKIEVYQTKAGTTFHFAGYLGESNLMDAQDIFCGTEDRIFVLDKGHPTHRASETKYIHVFSKTTAETSHQHLRKFEVASNSVAIASPVHLPSEHLVIASRDAKTLLLSLYTTDGERKRKYELKETDMRIVSNITVTAEGRIVVALIQQHKDEDQGKVIVL